MTASKIVAAAASGVGGAGLDVNEVFSTFVYDGNSVGNSIENGINLGNDTEERVLLNLSGDALTDTGPNTLTVSNSSVAVNTSTKKYGTGSLRFNGSATATVTDASLILGTSDFTIEFWLYLDSLSLKGILNIGNPSDHTEYSMGMYVADTGAITVQYRNTPNNMGQFSTSAATANMSATTWHHVAIVRHNNTLSAYLDGSVIGTDDITGTTVGWNQLELGTHWGTSGGDDYRFTGYIDDFRISKKAVYTANFTAPSSAHSTSYTSTTGEGGLVWIKGRNGAKNHRWFDSARGISNGYLTSNLYNAENFESDQLTAFNSNGFSIGGNPDINHSASNNDKFVSWTFRKAKKFFDVVTYTGNNSVRTIAHNLGSTPGMIIIKRRDSNAGGGWTVFHRSTTDTDGKRGVLLNTDDQQSDYSGSSWDVSEMSSTHFGLGSANDMNGQDRLYVAYIFAHNNSDGGFGPDGDQDIIKCASYTGNGGSTETGSPLAEINLGFEPQWLMIKRAEGGTEDWIIIDNIRGFDVNIVNKPILKPNASEAESSSGSKVVLTSSGFKIEDTDNRINANNNKYIYMAIRRGSLNTPEDATDVFDVDMYTGGQAVDTNFNSAGFPADMLLHVHRIDTVDNQLTTRLTNKIVVTNEEDAEISTDYVDWDNNSGWVTGAATSGNTWRISSGTDKHVVYAWKRASGYFDVSCYTGTGVYGLAVNHNLGVVPEMMWVKQRNSNNDDWFVYHSALGNTKWLELNETTAEQTHQAAWNNTSPTATQFTVGAYDGVNGSSSATYVAMLFATVAGVSKVGNYTGTGSAQNIDCGFSNGARFVLIKRTDTTGSWHFFDTSRGIVSGNDPVLQLNNNQNENTFDDYIDPHSSGFSVTAGSGYNFIFYAIA